MSDGRDNDADNVPDDLEGQLDDLAEALRDPGRADRTIEDQGEAGSIREGTEASDEDPAPSG